MVMMHLDVPSLVFDTFDNTDQAITKFSTSFISVWNIHNVIRMLRSQYGNARQKAQTNR